MIKIFKCLEMFNEVIYNKNIYKKNVTTTESNLQRVGEFIAIRFAAQKYAILQCYPKLLQCHSEFYIVIGDELPTFCN